MIQNESILAVSPQPQAGENQFLSGTVPPFPSLGIRKILVPFDFSRASLCVLRAVSGFAERVGATVFLLHVLAPTRGNGGAAEQNHLDDSLAEASEKMLKYWARKVVAGRVPTYVSVRLGDPVDRIVARAAATRSDLIVMTTRACSGRRNEWQRSAPERVSRLASCPVLTIPEKCIESFADSFDGFPASSWKTVMTPVDFSRAAEQGLRFAAAIAVENRARLVLAHGPELNADESQTASDTGRIHQRLQEWVAGTLNVPVPCETAAWPGGHSLYAILAEAARARADLIVLPTRANAWATRWRAGSITDGVLRQATCPVLSVPENMATTE